MNSWIKYLPGGEQIAALNQIEAIEIEIKRLRDLQKGLELQVEEIVPTIYTVREIRNAHRQALEMGIAA